jgi:uncharacterized protein YbcV (DUF1398 family)
MNYYQARALNKGDKTTVVVQGVEVIITVDTTSNDELAKVVYISGRSDYNTFYASIPHSRFK